MPREVFSPEEILELAKGAKEVRIVRRGDKVKIKARRSRYLYTYVASPEEAEDIIKKIRELKVPIVEL